MASQANCPVGSDELQWLLTNAWNRGVSAHKESKLEEAEQWMAISFNVSHFSPTLAPLREQLNVNYQKILKQLDRQQSEHGKVARLRPSLSTRVLDADEEIQHRRQRQRCS
jgi:hypothetical protein